MMEKNQVIPINQDEVQIYLKELRRIKVMTPERERLLAERISSTDCTDREKEAIQKGIEFGIIKI